MNENLDLTKILDGCPEGTKLYSAIYGEVSFAKVNIYLKDYPIWLSINNGFAYYAKDGRFIKNKGECTLFPSKEQRDWSKFERFWDKPKVEKIEKFDPKTLQPFDKILARDGDHHIWTCALLSHIDDLNEENKVITVGSCYMRCIPYNEETKHLIGTTDDCPEYYKWWGDE